MSKTEQKLIEARSKRDLLLEKKDKLMKEIAQLKSSISSLEKQSEREKINDGIVRIQASGFSIDEIIDLIVKEKHEKEGEIK